MTDETNKSPQSPPEEESLSGTQSAAGDQALLNDSEQLIQQALSAFNLQGIAPVPMAFPNIINNQQANSETDFAVNVQQLFAEQAQLFNPPPITEAAVPQEQNSEAEAEETQEMQAIRAMFDAN